MSIFLFRSKFCAIYSQHVSARSFVFTEVHLNDDEKYFTLDDKSQHEAYFFQWFLFFLKQEQKLDGYTFNFASKHPSLAKMNTYLRHFLFFFTFFYMHKKKVLDLRKFSTSGFGWIYMFWDVPSTIWPFLEIVWLSVCMSPKFCGHSISRTYKQKLMKFYIQLHLDLSWCWLDFSVYHSRSSDVFRYFWLL